MRLILLRHGETLWNKESRLQGHSDTPLSYKGVEQAVKIKPIIRNLNPQKVFTSDLGRAIKTSQLIGYPEAIQKSELRELDMGEWTGLKKTDLIEHNADLYQQWRSGEYTPNNGENWFDFCKRIEKGLSDIVKGEKEDVLAVVHSGVIRAACTVFLNLSPEHLLPVTQGTITIIHFSDTSNGSAKLEAYNIGPFIPQIDVAD